MSRRGRHNNKNIHQETTLRTPHNDIQKRHLPHPMPCFCNHAHPGCHNDRLLKGTCKHPSISESLRALKISGLSEKEIASAVARVFPPATGGRDHYSPEPICEKPRRRVQKTLFLKLFYRRLKANRRVAGSYLRNDLHTEIEPSTKRISHIKRIKNNSSKRRNEP